MKTKKIFISIIISFVLLLSLMPISAFAANDTTEGSFQTENLGPTITSVEIWDAAGTSPLTSMTPGTAYRAKIVAGDANTVDDIDQVRVAIVFDSTDSDPTTDPGETGNTQTLACLKWVKSTDTWSISPTGGTPATTWSITDTSCTKPADMNATQGTWEFYFTVGKVATEGIGGSGNDGWDLFGEVNDEVTSVELWGDRDLAMDWYGEIAVNTENINWGTLTAGTGFSDGINEQGSISVTYIANGNYAAQVQSAATWSGASYNATFDETGACAYANEFSLKAFISDTYTSAVQVDDTTGVTIDSTGVQTDDDGTDVTSNTLWMKLASSFQGDTYQGLITYIIANR